MLGWARKASGCSTPWDGRPQRPPTDPATTGRRPTATKTSATTLTTWRHPNSRPVRSSSKAEIPRPTQAATASAAGARTTDSDGVNDPRSPRVAAKARPHDAHAVTHRRAAQVSLTPLPTSSGRAAPATRSHTTGEWAAGPTAKRMTSPQFGAEAPVTGNPKIATAPLPASTVPSTQGAASTRATATASTATRSTRHPGSRVPTRSEPTVQASAMAMTIGTTAGAKLDAAAMRAPRMAIWPDGRVRHLVPGSVPYGSTPAARASRQRDEREGGIGDEAVPAARAQRAVGQRELRGSR